MLLNMRGRKFCFKTLGCYNSFIRLADGVSTEAMKDRSDAYDCLRDKEKKAMPEQLFNIRPELEVAATIIGSTAFFVVEHWASKSDNKRSAVIFCTILVRAYRLYFPQNRYFRSPPKGYFCSVSNAIFYAVE